MHVLMYRHNAGTQRVIYKDLVHSRMLARQ
jgi:hypothetical protein